MYTKGHPKLDFVISFRSENSMRVPAACVYTVHYTYTIHYKHNFQTHLIEWFLSLQSELLCGPKPIYIYLSLNQQIIYSPEIWCGTVTRTYIFKRNRKGQCTRISEPFLCEKLCAPPNRLTVYGHFDAFSCIRPTNPAWETGKETQAAHSRVCDLFMAKPFLSLYCQRLWGLSFLSMLLGFTPSLKTIKTENHVWHNILC